MRFDRAFLQRRGILKEPLAGVLEVYGEPAGHSLTLNYMYDETARLFYFDVNDSRDVQDILMFCRSRLMSDYLWMCAGDELYVFRMYGEVRRFELTAGMSQSDQDERRGMLIKIDPASLDILFSNRHVHSQLIKQLLDAVQEMSTVLASKMPFRERMMTAFSLIRVLLLLNIVNELDGMSSNGKDANTFIRDVLIPSHVERRLRTGLVNTLLSVMESMMQRHHKATTLNATTLAILKQALTSDDAEAQLDVVLSQEEQERLRVCLDRTALLIQQQRWSVDPWNADFKSVTPGLLEQIDEYFTALDAAIDDSCSTRLAKQLVRAKRRTGSFYTPETNTHYLTSRTLAIWFQQHFGIDVYRPMALYDMAEHQRVAVSESLSNITVLDPAVGAGAFLRAAADWLDRVHSILCREQSTYERRRRIVEQNLFGVDILDSAVHSTILSLSLWVLGTSDTSDGAGIPQLNVRQGNSLIETTDLCQMQQVRPFTIQHTFDWHLAFPTVFCRDRPGFDIVIGNPPYGNITSVEERRILRGRYALVTRANGEGTWNIVAPFIARSTTLLRPDGVLGLLVPNSVLRVKQFYRTRQFILNNLHLHEIIDEGRSFPKVTLEMVSIIASKRAPQDSTSIDEHITDTLDHDHKIRIFSRRKSEERRSWYISHTALRAHGIFMLYHDEFIEKIIRRGMIGAITATRGIDIPGEHVRQRRSSRFNIPYIASGRGLRNYYINEDQLYFTDDSFLNDSRLVESYESEFLIATKNLQYPRCVIKPVGFIHGGGVVRLDIRLDKYVNPRIVGLILNSELIRHICSRYYTNNSQFTTCLNTGIMEELPLILPREGGVYIQLFDLLTEIFSKSQLDGLSKDCLQSIADALIYELYLTDDDRLHRVVASALDSAQIYPPDKTALALIKRTFHVARQVLYDPCVYPIRQQLKSRTYM